jgi:thiamine pyrophosphate-dependent acetolactate synthase large subunit-like protein
MSHVSEVVAQVIAEESDRIFGVMGNGNAYFIDAALDLEVTYTSLRHEAGAVCAADAYHRISGRLGVATVTYGPGFTNTLTALTEAQRAATALLLVVGDAPLHGPRQWDTDQHGLATASGVTTFRITNPQEAAPQTRAAIDFASKNLQPAILSIPHDLAVKAVQVHINAPAQEPERGTVFPHPGEMESVAALLHSAERPLILAGRGARLADAGPALDDVSHQLGALTATTLLGRGIFTDKHSNLGIAGGFGQEAALGLMKSADVVLVVGARLNQFTMHFGSLLNPDAHVIQIDYQEQCRHPRADSFLHGDGRAVAEALQGALDRLGTRQDPTWRSVVGDVSTDKYTRRPVGEEICTDGRLDPRNLAERLDQLLPEDRVLIEDLGSFCEWMPKHVRIPGVGRTAMIGSAFQSIGLGLPGVVGASAALPESTVILATGDGGALMALADLESVVREVISCVIVVFNDAAYGAEVHQYGAHGLDARPMLIDDVDFTAVAQAFGAEAVTVRTLQDLEGLEKWTSGGANGVLVLDCKISRSVLGPVLESISDRLERPVSDAAGALAQ